MSGLSAPPPFRPVGDVLTEVVQRAAEAVMVERVSVRPIRAGFAYASIRLRDVSLNGIEATRDTSGRVTLKCPMQRDRHGREWPVFALQPRALEAATAAVAAVWPPPNCGGAG
ncbi:MAG TPA: hypothetical protein VIL69_13770 [Roseomonas sp.]|jgi:hypothetical protein